MILKVKTVDECGWKFYDDVTEVKHWIDHADRIKDISCNDYFIIVEGISYRFKEEKHCSKAMVVCTFKQRGDEKRKMIVWNTTAYLLNDEGKTIERI